MNSKSGLHHSGSAISAVLAEPVLNEQDCLQTTDMDYFEDDLYDAIVNNNTKHVLDYLKKGLSPNHGFRSTDRQDRLGKTLLEVAVQEGKRDVVKVLVENKCNANKMYIVNVNNFTYHLQEYKKKSRLRLTTMYRCIVQRDLEMIKLLVQGGFDVNTCDERGCTALWHAVDLNDYDMTKIMVGAKNVDVNAHDTALLRPIHIAAMKGNHRMVSLLIQKGADVDIVQLRGSTALILACRKADFETVRLLLLNGANPNHVGYNGHTPISTVLQWSMDRRLPELLIECGANVDLDLIRKCREEFEKLPILSVHPDLFGILKECSETPRSLKTYCCLTIRSLLVKSHKRLHLIKKAEELPLPKLMKDFLLWGHL